MEWGQICGTRNPSPVAELNTNISNIEENLNEVKDLLKETLDMLPKNNARKALKEVQKMAISSSDLLGSCKTATGGPNSQEVSTSSAASRLPIIMPPEKVSFYC